MNNEQIVIGYHAIEEALKHSGKGSVLYISQKNQRISELIKTASKQGVRIKRDSNEHLNTIGSPSHRGAVLILSAPAGTGGVQGEVSKLTEFLKGQSSDQSLVLVLDGITDPQNLGAILRSADQFGVDLVILPSRRSVKVNSTVLKTSAGAGIYVNVCEVTNIVRSLEALKEKGFWIYGAGMDGEPVWNSSVTGRTVLVLGAEGRGISRLVGEKCDTFVRIPTMGHIDSLNVSVAAGILLYEYRRQMIGN